MKDFPEIEKTIGELLIDKKLNVSSAESCTGGLISSRLTDVSGSSAYVKLNFVTYSNQAKQEALGVKEDTLINYGAVSEQTVIEMAKGCLKAAKTDISIAISGIAGPSGGTAEKPVGLCYICISNCDKFTVEKITEPSETNRKEMKYNFSQKALLMLKDFIIKNY